MRFTITELTIPQYWTQKAVNIWNHGIWRALTRHSYHPRLLPFSVAITKSKRRWQWSHYGALTHSLIYSTRIPLSGGTDGAAMLRVTVTRDLLGGTVIGLAQQSRCRWSAWLVLHLGGRWGRQCPTPVFLWISDFAILTLPWLFFPIHPNKHLVDWKTQKRAEKWLHYSSPTGLDH